MAYNVGHPKRQRPDSLQTVLTVNSKVTLQRTDERAYNAPLPNLTGTSKKQAPQENGLTELNSLVPRSRW